MHGHLTKAPQLTMKRSWQKYKMLYLLIAPGLLYLLIFRYIPMYGLVIAFEDFTIFQGVFGSKWIGLTVFRKLLNNQLFWRAVQNTVRISLLRLVFAFPAPIIFALLLNELKLSKFRRITQTVSYLPHFVSWVVLAGILDVFINPTNGVIIVLLKNLGYNPVNVMTSNAWFVPMLIITDIYKTIGYGSIVFLAAISSVDQEMYESAIIDGATRLQRVWYITLPSIIPVVCIMFIFNIGHIMDGGFTQIFLLYNSLVYKTADIIDTYIYRAGIVSSNYTIGAAASFFKSTIGMILILLSNYGVRLFKQTGLW